MTGLHHAPSSDSEEASRYTDSVPTRSHIQNSWASRPLSTGIPESIRDSVLSVDSSFSASPSMITISEAAYEPSIGSGFSASPSMITISETAYEPPKSPGYAPSLSSVVTEDSLASFSSSTTIAGPNALAVKAICGAQIVAFRIDRTAPLTDVHTRLCAKFAQDAGVHLDKRAALAYKPAVVARVKELRAAASAGGRSRSSSVSSIGSAAPDPSALRVIFGQGDWEDAVRSCPQGSKLTLHVLNG